MGTLRAVIAETWRFTMILAGGFAWAAPLWLLSPDELPLSVAVYPSLARLVQPALGGGVLLAVPVFAAAGAVAVALLLPRSRDFGLASIAAPLIFCAALGALFVPLLVGFDWWLVVVTAMPGVGVVIGALVTATVLWRRRAWMAAGWLAAWGVMAGFCWLASRQAEGYVPPGWSGLSYVFTGVGLLASLMFFGLIAFVVTGIHSRSRGVSTVVDETLLACT